MASIPYQAYDNMSKGKIASLKYKESSGSKETKASTRRKKGSRLTQKKKSIKKTPSPKKAETGMIVGKEYFIENTTRRKKENREVFTGTYEGTTTLDDDKVYLNFKNTKIIVSPFGRQTAPSGFSSSGYKFIEKVE